MEVKEESFDAHEEFIKTEPDYVSIDDSGSLKRESFKSEHDSDTVNIFQSRATGQFENIPGIKQEIIDIDCEVPKIEQRSDVPIKTEYDSLCENIQTTAADIKKELKTTDDLYKPGEQLQLENECDLLNTHCDLPTLKIENVDYPEYFEQPCSSKQSASESKPFKKRAKGLSKNKKRYSCPVCEKSKYTFMNYRITSVFMASFTWIL